MFDSLFEQEKNWLYKIFSFRMGNYFNKASSSKGLLNVDNGLFSGVPHEEIKKINSDITLLEAPDLTTYSCSYSDFIYGERLKYEERLLLALVFIPNLFPGFFEPFESKKDCVEYGFTDGEVFRGLIPTGLTFIQLYGGYDTKNRLHAMQLLAGNSVLFDKKVLFIEKNISGEPLFSGRLVISRKYTENFLNLVVTEKSEL